MSQPDTAHPDENAQASSPEQERMEVVFDQLLGTFSVPKDMDPVLLETWAERERRERGENVEEKPVPKQSQPLFLLFAAYIGVLGMILTILLGLWHGREAPLVLDAAIRNLLLFAAIGAFAGLVAEYAINESVETIVREVVGRSAPEA